VGRRWVLLLVSAAMAFGIVVGVVAWADGPVESGVHALSLGPRNLSH
jgi:hypothetical protein